MSAAIRTTGLNDAVTKLNKATREVMVGTKKGFIVGGFLLQREAQIRTPVDLRNLEASAFLIWDDGMNATAQFKGDDSGRLSSDHTSVIQSEQSMISKDVFTPEIELGFTAYYAIYVHEDKDAKHPGKGDSKFLEEAVEANQTQFLDAVAKEAFAG